jgi:hypothetical protein
MKNNYLKKDEFLNLYVELSLESHFSIKNTFNFILKRLEMLIYYIRMYIKIIQKCYKNKKKKCKKKINDFMKSSV